MPQAGDAPGTIIASPDQYKAYLCVACGEGALGLAEVQAAGKRRMIAGDFLRGARIAPGARLGEQ